MTEKDFVFQNGKTALPDSGSVSWKSPSNIALVKYWGKTEPQLPKNPSVSFTLNQSFTQTTLEFKRRKNASEATDLKVFFEGKENEAFKPKILKFMDRIEKYMPFLSEIDFVVRTDNSFPHSSGIASSASGMSALALCIVEIEKRIHPGISTEYFNRKASFLARLGSGSAARSIEGPVVVWGEHAAIPGSSDLYGIRFPFTLHPVFKNYHDTILLVDKGKKQVSSTLGHNLMNRHPFASARFKQANSNMEKITSILQTGDLDAFIALVESEALTLHAMMMSSDPYFILMKPNTLKIIEKIRQFRKETGTPVCFTLDAGANVHVLYPESHHESAAIFIWKELASLCENQHFIDDYTGLGATRIP